MLKKYPGTFKTEIISKDLSTKLAYALEGVLVGNETLADPLCLNIIRGGAFRDEGNPVYIKTRGDRIAATRRQRMCDPEFKMKCLKSLKKATEASRTKLLNTPYIIDNVEYFMSYQEFAVIRSNLSGERWKLHKNLDGTFSKIDCGYYCRGVRYSRLKDLEQKIGSQFNRLVWVGNKASLDQVAKKIEVDGLFFTKVEEAKDYVKANKPGFELIKLTNGTKRNPPSYSLQIKCRKSLGRPKKTQNTMNFSSSV